MDNSAKLTPVAVAFVLSSVAAVPAAAQNTYEPWAQIQTTSAMIGIGGQSGAGRLNLPNLGTNCSYTFQVSGFGAGVQVGVSKVSASGPVKNLTRLEDFPGDYGATEGQATVIGGGGGISMKNKANNVAINLASQTAGLNIGFSGSGMKVNMPVPPMNAPRVLVLEYGFNKDRLNLASRGKLDQMLRAWKCRFVNFDIVGRTDAVGKSSRKPQPFGIACPRCSRLPAVCWRLSAAPPGAIFRGKQPAGTDRARCTPSYQSRGRGDG